MRVARGLEVADEETVSVSYWRDDRLDVLGKGAVKHLHSLL